MTILLAVWAWMKDNPVLVWGITSALASALYTKLEAYPRAHAVLSFLAGWGVDLPAILDAWRRLLGGLPPVGPSGGGPYRSPPAPVEPPIEPPSPPAAAREGIIERWWQTFWAGVAVVVFALGINNCAWFQKNGAQTAADITNIVACVVGKENGNEAPDQIATECGLANAQAVIDIIKTMDKRATDRFECTRAGYMDYRMNPRKGDPL